MAISRPTSLFATARRSLSKGMAMVTSKTKRRRRLSSVLTSCKVPTNSSQGSSHRGLIVVLVMKSGGYSFRTIFVRKRRANYHRLREFGYLFTSLSSFFSFCLHKHIRHIPFETPWRASCMILHISSRNFLKQFENFSLDRLILGP